MRRKENKTKTKTSKIDVISGSGERKKRTKIEAVYIFLRNFLLGIFNPSVKSKIVFGLHFSKKLYFDILPYKLKFSTGLCEPARTEKETQS